MSNVGNAAATQLITVTDTLPAALAYVSAGGPGWVCVHNLPAVFTCTTDMDLAPNGASLPAITVVVNVGPGAVPSVRNVAEVTSACGDLNMANNADEDIAPAMPPIPTPAPLLSPVGLLLAVALVFSVGFHGLRSKRPE